MSIEPDLRYRHYIASAMKAGSVEIADLWLMRLADVVNEETRDIFPTDQYLDHIPMLIEEIGTILERPDENMALSNSLVERKADQLGRLRHQQRATVHQLLREYDLLAKVLEQFIIEKSELYSDPIESKASIDLMASVARIVRTILQSTVDSFVEQYMTTISEQTEKIVSFNAFISHELKSPLQAAQLNIELLMETKDLTDKDMPELLKIQSSVLQASALLKNIESLIQKSDTTVSDSPTLQAIDLSALLRDIRKQLADTVESRQVHMKIEDNMGTVQAEIAKVKLVFTNLLTNAIKYSDPRKSKRVVSVLAEQTTDEGQTRIIVKDNGLGIEEHMRQEVFKLRVRAHEQDDKQLDVTGYGMGLYLVAEALRDLNGTIEMTSEVGVGTQFRLMIPNSPKSNRLG